MADYQVADYHKVDIFSAESLKVFAESIIKEYLPEEDKFTYPVSEAMNYAMTGGGKRLRPILMYLTYKAFGGEKKTVEPFMAGIEMIHNYSLVHDDILDHDMQRHGKPSVHAAYGTDMAILCGDGLLNYAYETAAKAFAMTDEDSELRAVCRAYALFTQKPGINGMIGGQTADVYMSGKEMSAGEGTSDEESGYEPPETGDTNSRVEGDNASDGQSDRGNEETGVAGGDGGNPSSVSGTSAGGSRNTPYFFQGINYSALNPNDADSHGVSAVCRELHLFSDKRLVATFPIAATFLVRTAIEQSIIYYSKKHNIQGQNKLIWEDIKGINKLSSIINKYKTNLPNYITDTSIRQYFTQLFGNYEDNVDPLNWVVHRPAEFQLDSTTLIELPRKGLLTIINFLIS